MYLLDALGVLSLKLYFLDLLAPGSSCIVSWTSQTVPWPLKVYFLYLMVCPYTFYSFCDVWKVGLLNGAFGR